MTVVPDVSTSLRADNTFHAEPVFHFINGQFRAGREGHSFETFNPATNQPLTTIAEGLAEDVDDAVQAARAAFDTGPWPRMTTVERASFLMRIADTIEAHAEEIAQLEVHDVGLPITQARS
jgi:acyl-CoA reductase-like NAD-dependent aldehyde dehydrogenase